MLSRDLDELLGALPEERPLLPAKAVGKYVSIKLAEGDVNAAALGLEQILSAYSAPLPPMTVSHLGLMRDQVLDLRRLDPSANDRSSGPDSGAASEPRGMLVPAIRANTTHDDEDEWYEHRQRAARSRARIANSGTIGRTSRSWPPMGSTFTTAPPPASLLPDPADFRFLPVMSPAPDPTSAAPKGGGTGKWLLLGALGLGIGVVGWSEGWGKRR